MTPIYTVGHSNRSIREFIATLETVGVMRVVDVRRLRGSERYPQFDAGRLRETLGDVGVELTASPALTGRRPIDHDVDPAVNGWWENRSFHNYADHALSVEFAAALRLLLDAGAAAPTAVMCSEAVWWRCHRRIIADHLIALGVPVVHLMGPGRNTDALLSAGAVVGTDCQVTYPAGPAV